MKEKPSADLWLEEAKKDPEAKKCGMYLFHNGTVRESAKEAVRYGREGTPRVSGMKFSYDGNKVSDAVEETKKLDGIYYVRVWLNEGILETGDDIMMVLIGGDIRPRVVDALNFLVGKIKDNCVKEEEIY